MSDLGPLDEYFVRLIDNPAAGLLAVLLAVAVGAAHGLAPGHGKAMGAAYLVGVRGRVRDAVLLGAVVAAMHAVSVVVLALGLDLLLRRSTSGPPLPTVVADVAPGLRIAAGAMIITVGAVLAFRARRQHHHHHHDGAPSPLSRRGLIALGVSGGLLPSPSAFLVLATAAFTGRLLLGLLLVLAFSLGLAITITVVGLAAVKGRDLLASRGPSRWAQRLERLAPWVAAAVVVAVGIGLAVSGLRLL